LQALRLSGTMLRKCINAQHICLANTQAHRKSNLLEYCINSIASL
jgi:hypothetical protein